jgi:hypothetical protein
VSLRYESLSHRGHPFFGQDCVELGLEVGSQVTSDDTVQVVLIDALAKHDSDLIPVKIGIESGHQGTSM